MKHTMKKRLAMISMLALLPAAIAGCTAEEITYEKKSTTYEVSEVSSVEIDVRDGKIEFLPSEDGQIHLTYSESEKEFYNVELSTDKVLSIACGDSKEWSDYIGGKAPRESRTIQLQLPDAVLENLTVSTTNEDISLPSLSFMGSVRISANGGSIQLERLNAGKAITLETKNGDVNGSIVGAYDDFTISTQIKKGKSNLPESKGGGAKELTVSVNNGDIGLELVK